MDMFSKLEYVKKCNNYYQKLKDECEYCTKENKGIIVGKNGLFRNCECTKIYLKNKKYIESGIPIKYLDKFEEIEQNMSKNTKSDFTKILQHMDKIIGNCDMILNKCKKTTHGSSSVAMLFAKQLIDNGKRVLVIHITDLIQLFFERESGLRKLLQIPVLIIDNFGYEYSKNMKSDDYMAKMLLSFVQQRFSENKFTIISSSHTLNMMQKKYNPDIISFIEANYITFNVDMKKTFKSANDKISNQLPELKEMLSRSKDTIEKKQKQKPKRKMGKTNVDVDVENEW